MSMRLSCSKMRIAKHLAHAGVASRRAAEALVFEGRVTVGGEVVHDPARNVGESDAIAVDGRKVEGLQSLVVYALNKPLGVLSTAKDPYGRPTVVGLLEGEQRRLYPVGRLDLDSEGLILLTNDGKLAHALTHPRFEVPKTYRVSVSGGRMSEEALRRLEEGVMLSDGLTAPAEVGLLGKGDERSAGGGRRSASGGRRSASGGRRSASGGRLGKGDAGSASGPRGGKGDVGPASGGERSGSRARAAGPEQLLITIHEGRNRQVRRMCEAVGHPVLSLVRVRFGPLDLGEMAIGSYRQLSDSEVKALRDATALRDAAERERGEGAARCDCVT
jgi:23S rRNA pseudouridine2605 synthase